MNLVLQLRIEYCNVVVKTPSEINGDGKCKRTGKKKEGRKEYEEDRGGEEIRDGSVQ